MRRIPLVVLLAGLVSLAAAPQARAAGRHGIDPRHALAA